MDKPNIDTINKSYLSSNLHSGKRTKKRIAIVEHNHPFADGLAKAFEVDGHGVDLIFNGEDAERLLLSEPMDLIILDVNLPVADQWVDTGGRIGSVVRLVVQKQGGVAGITAIAIAQNERRLSVFLCIGRRTGLYMAGSVSCPVS